MALQRGDPQPDSPAGVVLLSPGHAFRAAAVDAAVAEADGDIVAVVVLARIHGYAFGLPNPGLLPNPRERATARSAAEAAIAEVERRGGRADGQVAIARNAAAVGARVARARGARVVVVDEPDRPAWRRVVEGQVTPSVARRLRRRARVIRAGGT
jgi:hypothetical protein